MGTHPARFDRTLQISAGNTAQKPTTLRTAPADIFRGENRRLFEMLTAFSGKTYISAGKPAVCRALVSGHGRTGRTRSLDLLPEVSRCIMCIAIATLRTHSRWMLLLHHMRLCGAQWHMRVSGQSVATGVGRLSAWWLGCDGGPLAGCWAPFDVNTTDGEAALRSASDATAEARMHDHHCNPAHHI